MNKTLHSSPIKIIVFLFIFILLASKFALAGNMPKKMQKLIEKREYTKAIEVGEKYLKKNPEAPDVTIVRELVMKAEYLALPKPEETPTTSPYENFEKKYPNSPYQHEVNEYKAKVIFRTIIELPSCTIADCRDFLEKYPDSSLAPKVRIILCELVWKETLAANTTEAWQNYRNNYGYCGRTEEALLNEIETAWTFTKALGTVEAFRNFLNNYPQSQYTNEARSLLCAVAWKKTESQNTLEGYRQFSNDFSYCPEAIQARKNEIELAWQETIRINTWEAYKDFLKRYPDAPQRQEAETSERNLWGFFGPLGPDELETRIVYIDDRNSPLIDLFFQVIGPDEQLVGGLQRENFSVYENGCGAEIVSFEGMESERPIDIVFIFDISGSMADEIEEVKSAIAEFTDNLEVRNRDVKLGLVTFTTEVEGIYPSGTLLTDDTQAFKKWINVQHTGAGGLEDALSAVVAGTKKSFRKGAEVIFILITDEKIAEIIRGGMPTGEYYIDAEGHIIYYGIGKPVFSYDEIIEMLNGRRISLFVIAPDEEKHHTLAESTGGMFFDIEEYEDFSELILHISTITAKKYHLVYRSTKCGEEDDEEFEIRVRARKSHIWLRATRIDSNNVSYMIRGNKNSNHLFIATRDSGVYRSHDGGITWEKIAQNFSDTFFEKLFSTSLDDKKLIALSNKNILYISTDGGKSWEVNKMLKEKILSVTQNPTTPNRIFACDGKSLFLSDDGGSTWVETAKLPSEVNQATLIVDMSRGERLIAILDGKSLSSKDGGKTLEPLNLKVPAPLENGTYQLFTHPNWKETYFIIGSDGKLYKSYNLESWRDITPLPSSSSDEKQMLCSSVAFDPSKRHWIILTTNQGIVASSDNGETWFTLADGIEVSDRILRVVTGDEGQIIMVGETSGNVYLLNSVVDREFISGNIYFASGSAQISPKLFGFLDKLVEQLIKDPEKKVRIEGHTDDVGKEDFNMQLSLKRAESVKNYLVSKGIAENRITVAGYGETRPLFPNNSTKNRAANRRVEITIIGKTEAIPPYTSEEE